MSTLECHSHGDARFSAFYAKLATGRSIESIYQRSKYDNEENPLGKGKTPSYLYINGRMVPCSDRLQQEWYLLLWYIYFRENPDLLTFARRFTHFRDLFAWKGVVIERGADYYHLDGRGCNQAAAIAYLCNDAMDSPPEHLFSGEVLNAYEKYWALHHS